MILETTIKLKANSEEEAKDTIEAYREESSKKGYTVKKAGYEYKTKKAKGEIIGEAWIVTITQIFGELWEDLE